MIDWHSHVLPGIDDGSRSVSESVSMLNLLKQQGVDTVIATPHFYADNNTVEEFLKDRELSYGKLRANSADDLPKVLLGAEVCYYPGISKLQKLKELCIEGTEILLLEMPFDTWTEQTVREVLELACSGEFIIVLAHIDRYIRLQNDAAIKELCQAGIYMQLNPDFRLSFFTCRKVVKLLSKGVICFIGSDCHNMNSRKPQFGEAINYIRKKFGDDMISRIDEFGYLLID